MLSENALTDQTIPNVDDLRGRAIRGASALLAGQVLRFGISMASQIYLARLLLPADFGVFAMIAPVIGFVTLFADIGLLQAVVQRRQVKQEELSAIFWITMGMSMCLGLLFAGLTPLLAIIYREPRVLPIGLVASAMIVVTGFGQVPGALLSRNMRFAEIVGADIAALLAALGVGVACASHAWGYWSLLVSQAVGTVTSTVLIVALARWWPSTFRRDPEVAGMLRFGGHITGTRVIGYINSTADNMMVGTILGKSALGIYDRAWRMAAQPLGQLCAPVDRLALPILSRLQDDHETYRRTFVRMVRLLFLLAMPGLLYGVVAADSIIPTLLGRRWLQTIPIFRWVCAGALISPVNSACFWLFISQSRGKDQLRAFTIVSVINVMSYGVGLRSGLIGVARLSALSVYLLQSPILVFSATLSGPVSRALFLNALWPVVLAISIAATILYPMTLLLTPSLATIAVGGLASYLFTFGALFLFGAGRRTLGEIWQIIPSLYRHYFESKLKWIKLLF